MKSSAKLSVFCALLILTSLFVITPASATSTYLHGYQVVATKAGTSDAREVPLLLPITILYNTPAKCEDAKYAAEHGTVVYLSGTNKDSFGHSAAGVRKFSELHCTTK